MPSRHWISLRSQDLITFFVTSLSESSQSQSQSQSHYNLSLEPGVTDLSSQFEAIKVSQSSFNSQPHSVTSSTLTRTPIRLLVIMEETQQQHSTITTRVIEETQMVQQEMDAPEYRNGYDAVGTSSPPRDETNENDEVCGDVMEKELVPEENLPQHQPAGNGDDVTEDDEPTISSRAALRQVDSIVKPAETSIFGPYPETVEHNEVEETTRVTKEPAKRYASTSSHKLGKMYDDEDEEEDEEVIEQIAEKDALTDDDDDDSRQAGIENANIVHANGNEEDPNEEMHVDQEVSDGIVTSSTSSKKRKRSPVRQVAVSVAVPHVPEEEDETNEPSEGESTRSDSPTPIAPKATSKSSILPKTIKSASKSASKPTPKKNPKPKAKAKATPLSTTPASRKRTTASATPANTKLNVVFSNSTTQDRPQIMQQFLALGARKAEKVTSKSDVLVVGNGSIMKTPKLLLAVALGKPVVRDEWVTECAKAGKLVDMDDYMPKDTTDIEWKVDNQGRQDLFKGKHLLVTPALKKFYGLKMWEEIQLLADAVGFVSITSTSARNAKLSRETIIVGKETEDLDLISLIEDENICYSKDLLSSSILRGNLDGIEEFVIKVKPQPGKQAAKRRKSAP